MNILKTVRNKENKIVLKQLFDKDGILLVTKKGDNTTTCYYGENGSLDFETIKNKDVTKTVVYYYDDFGNKVYSNTCNSGQLKDLDIDYSRYENSLRLTTDNTELFYRYNSLNKISYLKNCKTKYEQWNIYDKDGYLLSMNDSNDLSENYEYDKDHQLIKFTRRLRKDQYYIEEYKYDEDKLIEYTSKSNKKEDKFKISYKTTNKTEI